MTTNDLRLAGIGGVPRLAGRGEVWPGLSGFLAPAGDWLDIAVSVDASTGAVPQLAAFTIIVR